jgi:predicted small metal-binding protein
MAKTFACRDLGMNCDFKARAETEDKVLEQCAEHAKAKHGMNELPHEVVTKMRDLIRDESSEAVPSAS